MKVTPSQILVFLCLAQAANAALTVAVDSPSTLWTSINGNFDYLSDQGTGQPGSDIVGQGTNYGLLIAFNDNGAVSHTDGDLLFRVRLDDGGTFNDVVWIGINASIDGSIDAYLALNTKTNPDEIAIFLPGNDLNVSPSTTSIGAKTSLVPTSPSNYNFRPVDFNTDGGTINDLTTDTTGDPDYYLSFMVSFQSVVNFLAAASPSISITDQSALRFIVATSTQVNALNQDLGGVNEEDPNYDPDLSWSELGALSQSTSLVPEPSSALSALSSLAAFLLLRKRR